MSIESEFIDWINEHPDDNTTQMVYADWLDEQADPRAEGWRVLLEADRRPEYRGLLHHPPAWHWFDCYFQGEDPRSILAHDMVDAVEELFRPFKTFFQAMDEAASAWVHCYRTLGMDLPLYVCH